MANAIDTKRCRSRYYTGMCGRHMVTAVVSGRLGRRTEEGNRFIFKIGWSKYLNRDRG
jgi:hypothetical protein